MVFLGIIKWRFNLFLSTSRQLPMYVKLYLRFVEWPLPTVNIFGQNSWPSSRTLRSRSNRRCPVTMQSIPIDLVAHDPMVTGFGPNRISPERSQSIRLMWKMQMYINSLNMHETQKTTIDFLHRIKVMNTTANQN